ncbi:MAG: hypothetical protein HDS26_03315 [Bacteroides sp.]|nr:hypothetical protein [Bacteroides sp.]
MNIAIRQIWAAAFFAIAGVLPLCAVNGAILTDIPGVLPDCEWGTLDKENYDVAVHVGLPELEEAQIVEVSFPLRAQTGISNPRIWFSRNLTVESKVNVPDIASYEATFEDGSVVLRLENPVTVGKEGLYVGYSFTVDDVSSQEGCYPVACVSSGEDIFGAGFWVHSSRTYANKWRDLEIDREMLPAYTITLAGLPEASVSIELPDELYRLQGERTQVEAVLRNFGSVPVSSLTFDIGSPWGENSSTLRFSPADGEFFGYPFKGYVSITAAGESGSYEQRVRVSKVNGIENSNPEREGVCQLYSCSFRPVNRPLFEEYTGTGCGYCPRGALGMERLAEMFGDRFVGIAYHCSDIMSIAEDIDYPNYCPAQPDAYLNRTVQGDPWFGDDNSAEFGIADLWRKVADEFAPVAVELECDWKEEARETVVMKADFTFVRDYTDAGFELAYILVADGLTGSGRSWAQGNYYSGSDTGKWPAEFAGLIEAPNPMTGVTYDHVAVFLPSNTGIEGSIPSEIRRDEGMVHTFEIPLSEAVNLDGMSLIQDKGRLYGVVAVVDSRTKRVLNAARCDVPAEFSGIDTINSDAAVVSVTYLNMRGQRIEAPAAGEPYIMLEVRQDGTCSALRGLMR